MNTSKIASELRAAIRDLESQREDNARKIGAMERALVGLGARRGPGRPRSGTSAPRGQEKKTTRYWSPEAREAARERMTKYWANRKKAEKKGA